MTSTAGAGIGKRRVPGAADPVERGHATRTHVATGADALRTMGDELDELYAATATPVTARRRWQQAWVDCYRGWTPLVVAVGPATGTHAGRLDAAAGLAWQRTGGVTTVVGIGTGPADYLRLPARSPAAAEALAAAVDDALAGLPRPRRLTLHRLPPTDPVAATMIAVGGRSARLAPGPSASTTRFGEERTARAYMSSNEYRERKRMRNRLRREGRVETWRVLHDPDELVAALPAIEAVQRRRDAALGRASKLDHPGAGPFYRRVLLDHAEAGELEVLTFAIDGELASYLVAFRDGSAFRAWNTAFDARFAAYGPGRLIMCAGLDHALEDPACDEFDWMLGDEAYKGSFRTVDVPTVDLLAWSSPLARAVLDAPRLAKDRLRPIKRRHPALDQALERIKHRARKARHGR